MFGDYHTEGLGNGDVLKDSDERNDEHRHPQDLDHAGKTF